jgi:hypothetical protein
MKWLKLFEDFRNPLNEYLNQNEIWLKNYLNSDEDTKYKDVSYNITWLLNDFIDTIDLEDYFSNDEVDKLESMLENDVENYEIFELDFITDEFLIDYGKYVENNTNGSDMPTTFFFSDAEIIKRQWLIHLTDHAKDVWSNGFKYGTYDMTELGLTTYKTQDSKQYGGYNFAYTINDFERYGDTGDHRHNFKYGDEAILFRSSGVRAYHYGDDEYQTIFWGDNASDIIWLEYGEIEWGDREGEECWFIESRKTGKRLIESENINDLIYWVEKNYNQYKKHLVKNKNI